MSAFDASASQFAGGGFVSSQAPDSAQKPRSFEGRQQQTLRSLPIARLLGASDAFDGAPVVDGAPVQSVSVVGKIVRVEEHSLFTLYTLDDGSGRVPAKAWTANEGEAEDPRRASWVEGAYVHAHATLSEVDGQRVLLLVDMRAVEDFNEVTYHLAQIIFQHLHTLKTQAAKAADRAAPAHGGADAFLGGAGAGQGWGGAQAGEGYGAGAAGGAASDQELVKTILRTCDTAEGEGLTVHDLVDRSGGKLTAARAQLAVDALQNEGHIYSGGDTDHFKLCEF